jgi:hypothetical protein
MSSPYPLTYYHTHFPFSVPDPIIYNLPSKKRLQHSTSIDTSTETPLSYGNFLTSSFGNALYKYLLTPSNIVSADDFKLAFVWKKNGNEEMVCY